MTADLLPRTGTTVGVVGGGQLARMIHQAAVPLGVELVVLDPDPAAPAIRAGARLRLGGPDDPAALRRLALEVDVVTLDHERPPADLLEDLVHDGHAVRPEPGALRVAQDKAWARRLLGRCGFDVPPFTTAERGDLETVRSFGAVHGWPLVLKAPVGGYDGRGVAVVEDLDALAAHPLARRTPVWLLEARVPMVAELAVLVARRPSGWSSTYPVVETVQVDGICTELLLPARVSTAVAERATRLAVALADGLDACGILAVELFLAADDRLLVNEIAVRPHNSGHATIEACVTSQFENHLRGVLDWPLGATDLRAPAAAMANLLGGDRPVDPLSALPAALADPRVHVHLYGKRWAPGRKLGHVTALADDHDEALDAARRAIRVLGGGR